jgi:hypothetical protein
MLLRGYVRLVVVVLLAIVSISIVWQLFTANYPTHSDVFFMGVEAGVLAAVLLVCLVLIGFFLYRPIALPKRATAIEGSSISPLEPVFGIAEKL